MTLLAAQTRLFSPNDRLLIVDAGAHHGHTTLEYLKAFPSCRVLAMEPESRNHGMAAAALASFADRVDLIRAGLSDHDGHADLRLTSHDGAHSLLEVGDMRYYDAPVEVLPPQRIEVRSLDSLCAERGIQSIDILKMDIQGGELLALKGAESLLSDGAIKVVALEVLFQPLYRAQPTFWDLADHFRDRGYALQGIYEQQHHAKNHAVLRWADAVFVGTQMSEI